MAITKDELISTLEAEGVDLGKNPKRNLTFWAKIGVIPKPKLVYRGGKIGLVAYYDDRVIALIRELRSYQRRYVLQQIKEKFEREGKL